MGGRGEGGVMMRELWRLDNAERSCIVRGRACVVVVVDVQARGQHGIGEGRQQIIGACVLKLQTRSTR